MNKFTKKNLKFKYYWNNRFAADSLKKDYLFNKSEGNEVLCLINNIMVSQGWSSLKFFQSIESLIQIAPGKLKTTESIAKWVSQNTLILI